MNRPGTRRHQRDMRVGGDAIVFVMVGPMSLQFPKQLRALGNTKPIGDGTSDDEFALPLMGDEAIGDVSGALQPN